MTEKEVAFQIRMAKSAHEALQAHAKATDTSMNAIVNSAIVEFLRDSKRQREVSARFAKAQKDYRVALDKLKDL